MIPAVMTPERAFVAGPGAKLGQYMLVRDVGAGAMGRVFEAKHVELGRLVAVKILHSTLIKSPKARRRFLREGRACSRIRHPHVVQMLDAGVHDGQPYLVMELVHGVDLLTWLRKKQRLDPVELADIFLPLCSALSAVHQAGVIHRDLKPSNVILTRSSPHRVHPVLVDFGIARLSFSESTDDLTSTESTAGTLAYMAPEQTRTASGADPMADQYAVGVMLYECATGRKPFRGETHYDMIRAILHGDVVPPSRHRPDLDQEFDRIVLRALNRNPAERFPSVHALGAALLAVADARAWAEWSPEFCGTTAAAGNTRTDTARREPHASLVAESPRVTSTWPSFVRTPLSRRGGKAGILVALGTIFVLFGLAVMLRQTDRLKPRGQPATPSTLAKHRPAALVMLPVARHGLNPPKQVLLSPSTSPATARRDANQNLATGQVSGSRGHAPLRSSRGEARTTASSKLVSVNQTGRTFETSEAGPGTSMEHSLAETQRGTNGALIFE